MSRPRSSARVVGGVGQHGVAACAARRALRAEGEHAFAQFRRVERRDGLERAEIVGEQVSQPTFDLERRVLALERREHAVEDVLFLANGPGEKRDQLPRQRAAVPVQRHPVRGDRPVAAAGDEQVGGQHGVRRGTSCSVRHAAKAKGENLPGGWCRLIIPPWLPSQKWRRSRSICRKTTEHIWPPGCWNRYPLRCETRTKESKKLCGGMPISTEILTAESHWRSSTNE